MDLDLRDLVVFLAVQRQGSFGRAATELLLSQPAVSERVRHLERVVGRRVFERTARGASLTSAGETLLPYARRCVALAEETVDAARAADGAPPFVIAVHSTFATRVTPYVLGALGSLRRRISVRDAHSNEVAALVLDGVANVGFAIPAAAPSRLRRLPLPADPVACVASPDHPLATSRRGALSSLGDALIAVNAWGEGAEAFLVRLRDAGVDDWRVRFCADVGTATTLAHDHGHIAFVASSSVHAKDQGLRRILVRGLSEWTIRLDLLHRAADRDDEAIRTLVAGRHQA